MKAMKMLKKKSKKGYTPEDLLQFLVRPSHVRVYPDRVKINNSYNRVLMAVGYPRQVSVGFLDKIIRSNGDFDISLHIQPYRLEVMVERLNRLLRALNSDKYSAEREGRLTPSLDLLINDTRTLLNQIQSGEEKLFDIGLFINVKESDLKELDMSSKRVESELNSVMIVSRRPDYKMRAGIQSVMPLGVNGLGLQRTLTTSALSACMPFTTAFLDTEKGGILLAVNKRNNIPIIRDLFNLINPNVLCLSTSGAGKSFNTKVKLLELFMRGTKIFVIDPEDEYVELTKAVGGEVIEISKESSTIINVMDLMGQHLDEKILSLLTAFRIMFDGLSEPQTEILEKAIRKAYAGRGITLDNPYSWRRKPPVLGDVLNALYEMKRELRSGSKVWATYETLIRRLERYVTGVFGFMNKHTNINLNSKFVCFHIRNMPALVKPVMMYLIMEYVSAQMKKDRSRKVLAIDEAWMLLKHASTESYIFDIVKRSRKYNLSFMIITQQVDDLLQSPAGKAVLSNTSCKFLFKQDPTAIDAVCETFKLTKEERRILQSASVGEGILILDSERYHIQVIASPRVQELAETKGDFLRKRELAKASKKGGYPAEESHTEIDTEKGLYKKSSLSESQVQYLLSKGYVETKQVGFERKGAEWYLIKPDASPANMGMDHLFLVKLIEQEVRKYTDDVRLAQTKGPDIVFKNGLGVEVAVEVETGKTILSKPEQIKEKVEQLNEKYGKSWFFVLTDASYRIKTAYEPFGETITRTMVPERIRGEFE